MKTEVGNSLIKKIGFAFLFLVYFAGGINHFINPKIYIPLIPPYFIYLEALNDLSGFLEIILALGLLFKSTRFYAAYGILLLLIAFIPAHVYFIQKKSCISDSLCFSSWVAWVRLLLIHPFLMWWAYSYRNYGTA